jgi:hypothetical protein
MSGNTIIVLIHHRHNILDLVTIIMLSFPFMSWFRRRPLSMRFTDGKGFGLSVLCTSVHGGCIVTAVEPEAARDSTRPPTLASSRVHTLASASVLSGETADRPKASYSTSTMGYINEVFQGPETSLCCAPM